MSRAVRIAAIGHCSALGLTVHDAATAAADHSAHAAGTRTVLGQVWPWFAMALASDDREQRARDAVGRVGAALAAALPAAEWASTPLFVASSSLQMGVLEAHARHCGRVELPADAAAFAHQVADWLGLSATPWTISTTCTSALAALDVAATLIRSGAIERALVLGIELANDTTLAGFAGLGLLARSPEDAGLVLGEAVAGVLLCAAPAASPAAAPAAIPTAAPTAGTAAGWFIRACRLGIDGHSPTGPAPDGAAIAAVIRAALTDAGLAPPAIDVLKPHGGGLDATAAAEARALDAVFDEQRPAQFGFKHMLGHTLGASGLAELGLLLATLDHGPSTAQHALLNVIGFGGSIGALVVSRDPATADPAVHSAHGGTATERARIRLAVDSPELSRRARSALGAPLRRAGQLVELCLAGIDACLDACTAAGSVEAAPARSTAVLLASRSGPRVAFERVLADLCVGNEDPMPFDFLATQAALAGLPLRQRLPNLQAACYLPLSGATDLHWARMTTLARAWLASGRHDRVLIGMVEPGAEEHCCEWRCYA